MVLEGSSPLDEGGFRRPHLSGAAIAVVTLPDRLMPSGASAYNPDCLAGIVNQLGLALVAAS